MTDDDNKGKSHKVTPMAGAPLHVQVTPGGPTAVSSEHGISVNLGKATNMSIANIPDVFRHDITQAEGNTRHHVIFKNGGTFELIYDSTGKIVRATAYEAECTMTGTAVIFGMKKE